MSEATDALMATLGEYDVLWDGTLPPEIIDAEFYDGPRSGSDLSPDLSPDLPFNLWLSQEFELVQIIDRMEALEVLIEVVKGYVGTCVDAPLFAEIIDAEMYDCPTQPPSNWP